MKKLKYLSLLVPLAIAVGQIVIAYIALGAPQVQAGLAFFSGSYPTVQAEIAAGQLVAWVAILCGAIWSMGIIWGEIKGKIKTPTDTRFWAASVTVFGVLVLAIGIGHHLSSSTFQLSGGSVQQAEAQLGK